MERAFLSDEEFKELNSIAKISYKERQFSLQKKEETSDELNRAKIWLNLQSEEVQNYIRILIRNSVPYT